MTITDLCLNIGQYELGIANTIVDKCRFKPKTNDELQTAVDIWCYKRHVGLKRYGPIEIWDTSLITDMNGLFECKCVTLHRCFCGKRQKFDDDISSWDVSNVINMKHMFSYCHFFHQDLSEWDVSNVVNNQGMFQGEWGDFSKEYLPKFEHPDNKYIKNIDNSAKRCKIE